MIHHDHREPFDVRDYETQHTCDISPWADSGRLDRGITNVLTFLVALLVITLLLYHGINWILSKFDLTLTVSLIENLFGHLT